MKIFKTLTSIAMDISIKDHLYKFPMNNGSIRYMQINNLCESVDTKYSSDQTFVT